MEDINVDLVKALNLDLEEQATPLVAAGTYNAVINQVSVNPTRDGNGKVLHLTLSFPEVVLQDGSIVPYFILEDWISLRKTEKYDPSRRLAELSLAAFGKIENRFVPAELLGRKVRVIVVVEEDSFNGPRNRVRRYLPMTPATT